MVSKQVDLVLYKGGERIVIGKVALNPDGSFQGQIARDIRAEVKLILSEGIGDISINPIPRKQYNNVKVVDHSKIQE